MAVAKAVSSSVRVRIGKRASLRRVLGAGSTQKQSFLPAECEVACAKSFVGPTASDS